MERNSRNANLQRKNDLIRSTDTNNMPTRPNPSVVRCLFPDPHNMEAKHDNAMNTLKDIIAGDAERMRLKWNYDSEKDQPLDGAVKWEKPGDNRYHWIGVISNNCENEVSDTAKEVNAQSNAKTTENVKESISESRELSE